MENWHIDPNTGIMVSFSENGWMLAVPGRSIEHYAHEEVEHVTIATGATSGPQRRTVAGNQTH